MERRSKTTRARGKSCVVLVTVALLVGACTPTVGTPVANPSPSSASGSPSVPIGAQEAASGIPVGQSDAAVTIDGVQRTYHLYRPADLPATTPLVVMLHGGFGSGAQAERSYGWDSEADSKHFLVAYPDGLDHAWSAGGGCCGKPGAAGVDDVAFIEQMVAAINAGIHIDTARIYATGISNGGIMSYRLACSSSLFAAIGPDSATQLGDCPHPQQISIIHLHGTADTRIPYNGGQGQGVAKIDGPAVPDLNAMWRSTDQCATPTSSKSGVVTTSVAHCEDGRSVELITIEGAGHQWPGAAADSKIQKLLGADPPSTAVNATDTIWTFFAAHHR